MQEIRVKDLKPGISYKLFSWQHSFQVLKSMYINEFGCNMDNKDGTGYRFINPESFATVEDDIC